MLELIGEHDETAIAGGTRRNRTHAAGFSTFAADVPEAHRWLVCDAITSGCLLAAVPASTAALLPGTVVGRLLAGTPGAISVV